MRYRLILIICFAYSSLLGQQTEKKYSLRGVNDSLYYSILIKEDLVNEVATFFLEKNAVKIFGVQEIQNVTIHTSTFLEIQFRVRGGSGVKIRRTVLLCTSHGKMYKALDVLSEVTSRLSSVYDEVADSLELFDEKEDYHITLSVTHTHNKYFKVVLSESIRVESKNNPEQNVFFEKSYELEFDSDGYFFYTSIKQLNKLYKIYLREENKTVERLISAEVHCIQLYDKLYLLINNEWYLDNGDNVLSSL